jgi:hypothetical protein
VTPLDNTVAESAETVIVMLTTSAAYTAGTPSSATVTIADNDATKFYVVNDASSDRTYAYANSGTATENYPLGSGNTGPRGAASNAAGDKVWVADANKKVYVYTLSGGLLGTWTAGSLASNAQVEGIATNGTDIWLVDARQDKVFKYTGAAGRTAGSQNADANFLLAAGNTNPQDIADPSAPGMAVVPGASFVDPTPWEDSEFATPGNQGEQHRPATRVSNTAWTGSSS